MVNICVIKIFEIIKNFFNEIFSQKIVEEGFTMENQITKNFTLEELTYSDTAKRLNIENKPTEN